MKSFFSFRLPRKLAMDGHFYPALILIFLLTFSAWLALFFFSLPKPSSLPSFFQRMEPILWGITFFLLLAQGALLSLQLFRGIPPPAPSTSSEFLLEKERKILLACEGAELGYYLWNIKTGEITINHRWAEMLGYSPHELRPHISSWEQLIHPEDLPSVQKSRQEHLDGQTSTYQSEHRLLCHEGDYKWILDRGKIIEYDKKGHPLRLVGTHLDIDEQKLADEQLRKATREAESAAAIKTQFIANISHEIRTPLNAIIGMSELLQDSELTSIQREFVDLIRQSSDNLLMLINDILDFSKLESDKLELSLKPLHLAHCIEESLDLVANAAYEKNLSLAYYLAPDVPQTLLGDEPRLRQILVNLLSNGVKFTDQGEILVTVNLDTHSPPHRARLLFQVQDTGVGIPEDRLNRLFKSFSQADSSMNRRYGGTGLGLAISQKLVNMMGGEIRVASSVGKGTQFHFHLVFEKPPGSSPSELASWNGLKNRRILVLEPSPGSRRIICLYLSDQGMHPISAASHQEAYDLLIHQPSIEAALLPATNHDIDSLELATEIRTSSSLQHLKLILQRPLSRPDEEKELLLFDHILFKPLKRHDLLDALSQLLCLRYTSPLPEPTSSDYQETTRIRLKEKQLSILIAEDNPVNQKVAAGLLAQLGQKPDIAQQGKEALEALYIHPYHVILMDVQMPEMDGLEATREIRRRFPQSQQPWIIAMTANALAGDREECLRAGMDDFLSKPLSGDRLAAALQRYIHLAPLTALPTPRSSKTTLDPSSQFILSKKMKMTRLDSLKEALGEEGVQELLDIFIEDTQKNFSHLEQALKSKDTAEVKKWAHRIKGSAANLGADLLAQAASTLEQQAKSGHLEQAQTLMPTMKEHYTQWIAPFSQS